MSLSLFAYLPTSYNSDCTFILPRKELSGRLDRKVWTKMLGGEDYRVSLLVSLPEAWRLSVREDAYIPKELRRWGLRMVFLPAWTWIQATAFLSRSSHSDFMSCALAWSQSTAKTVAQPEESSFCTIDRDFPEAFKLEQETPQENTKTSTPSLLTLPQTVTKCDYQVYDLQWILPGSKTSGQQSTES